MSSDNMPTRRDVLSGAVGLAAGGLYPLTFPGAEDAQGTAQARHEAYRYAGKRWWVDEYALGGVNPDRDQATGRESGFERYQSLVYMRFTRSNPGQEPPTGLPTDNTYGMVRRGDPAAVLYVAEVFNRWAQDMTTWAKAVREDVLRLEDHLKLPHGDPGDPPPVPWK